MPGKPLLKPTNICSLTYYRDIFEPCFKNHARLIDFILSPFYCIILFTDIFDDLLVCSISCYYNILQTCIKEWIIKMYNLQSSLQQVQRLLCKKLAITGLCRYLAQYDGGWDGGNEIIGIFTMISAIYILSCKFLSSRNF